MKTDDGHSRFSPRVTLALRDLRRFRRRLGGGYKGKGLLASAVEATSTGQYQDAVQTLERLLLVSALAREDRAVLIGVIDRLKDEANRTKVLDWLGLKYAKRLVRQVTALCERVGAWLWYNGLLPLISFFRKLPCKRSALNHLLPIGAA